MRMSVHWVRRAVLFPFFAFSSFGAKNKKNLRARADVNGLVGAGKEMRDVEFEYAMEDPASKKARVESEREVAFEEEEEKEPDEDEMAFGAVAKVHSKVGEKYQAEIPPRRDAQERRVAPDWGEALWIPSKAAPVEGEIRDWCTRVIADKNVAEVEVGRIKAAVMAIVHDWDYDMEAVKKHWDRIVKLRPLPPCGLERWTPEETFVLQQLLERYPTRFVKYPVESEDPYDFYPQRGSEPRMKGLNGFELDWLTVACHVMTNRTRGEIQERWWWLIGEMSSWAPEVKCELLYKRPPLFEGPLIMHEKRQRFRPAGQSFGCSRCRFSANGCTSCRYSGGYSSSSSSSSSSSASSEEDGL